MMYIAFVVCILFLILSIKRIGSFFNPIFLFYVLWSVILLLNMIRAYGINETQNNTFILIIIGFISLYFGGILGRNSRKIHFTFAGKSPEQVKHTLRYSVIYMIMIFTAILLLLDTIVAIKALMAGRSLTTIRSWYTAAYGSGKNPFVARRSYFEEVLRVVLIEPFCTALPILCAINIYGERKNKIFLASSIMLMIMNVVSSGGGRLSILIYVITFLICFFIYKRDMVLDRNTIKKYSRLLMYCGIIGFLGVVFLTTKRTSTSVIEEVYYYFAMCVPLLDRWMPYIEGVDRTYGMLGIFGLVRIPFLILENIGLQVPRTYKLAQGYILQANYFYNVGARTGNSFVSPFYYLYLDGGIFGIIIGMFLLGLLSEIIYQKIIICLEDRNVYFLLLFIQASLMSFIRWQFIGTAFFMSFLYSVLFFKKEEVKRFDRNEE